MMYIKNQKRNCDCLYQAHVWFSNHSHQFACFSDKMAAEGWAGWLQKKIVTDDMIKAMYRGKH